MPGNNSSAQPAPQAEASPAPSPGVVLDNAGLLSADQKAALEKRLRESAARTHRRLVIVTLPSLQGVPLDKVVDGLGSKLGLDDGVMLVVAIKEREVRLAVGKGAHKLISNAEAQRIVDHDMRPDLHANRFDKGILKGADSILSQLSETAA